MLVDGRLRRGQPGQRWNSAVWPEVGEVGTVAVTFAVDSGRLDRRTGVTCGPRRQGWV